MIFIARKMREEKWKKHNRKQNKAKSNTSDTLSATSCKIRRKNLSRELKITHTQLSELPQFFHKCRSVQLKIMQISLNNFNLQSRYYRKNKNYVWLLLAFSRSTSEHHLLHILLKKQQPSITCFTFCWSNIHIWASASWFKINIWASPAFSVASLCLSTNPLPNSWYP